MDLKSIPMFSALRASMTWLDRRQKVLAQNVANADMPGYRAKDLEELDFARTLRSLEQSEFRTSRNFLSSGESGFGGSGFGTHDGAGVFTGSRMAREAKVRVLDAPGSETSPDGNSVVLEEQMMKIAETQIQFDAAANLYQKGLNLIRLATKSQ